MAMQEVEREVASLNDSTRQEQATVSAAVTALKAQLADQIRVDVA